ncbi:MAG: helix-turn-helix domain-containing protein [Prevotellaceae bacterium]|jgi:HTH-type transcriptional regulator/antitoxin HigA|nr:helix-turn-helix domain-containing protein [Prevotellaceae bacterium]
MARIKNETQYQKMLKKVEQLMEVVTENTPETDPDYIELDLLADLVEEYEIEHHPIGSPSLIEALKLRMYEMNLTQNAMADLIGVSASRVSELLNGKIEPTYQIARNISQKLKIDASIVLGV